MSINGINMGSLAAIFQGNNTVQTGTQATTAPSGTAAAPDGPPPPPPPRDTGNGLASAVSRTLAQFGLLSSQSSGTSGTAPSGTATSSSQDSTLNVASNPALGQAMHAFMYELVRTSNEVSGFQDALNATTAGSGGAVRGNAAASAAAGYANLSNRLQVLAQSLSTGARPAQTVQMAPNGLDQAYRGLLEAARSSGGSVSSSNGQSLQSFVNALAHNMQQVGLNPSGALVSTKA